MNSCLIPEVPEDWMYTRHTLLLLLGLNLMLLSWIPQDLCAQTALITISEIKFSGNQSIPADRLKSQLRRSREGGRYREKNLSMDLHRVKESYLAEGFLKVEVGPPDVQVKGEGEVKAAVITIPVVEGAKYRVGRINIRNVHKLSSETLMQMCPLKKGESYNRIRISQWQQMIEDTYRSMGYIRILCNAQEELNEADKTVDCTVECNEGKSYTIGKITLVGDESIDASRFKRQLLFSEGGLFAPEMLATSIQYLNKMRVYKPISYSDVQIDIHDEEGTVDLAFRVFLAER
jgi:outer membrane protein insertion porin family